MEAYDPVRKEAATRDVSARGIFDQIRFGKAVDGGVVLDVSAVPDEVFRRENSKVVERLDPHGIDYRAIPLILAPEAHFVMGGVLIDEWGGAEPPGLYACGETAGGVHGGNRLNSNAVPETQVFGHRAGQAARPLCRRGGAGAVDDRALARWTAGSPRSATRARRSRRSSRRRSRPSATPCGSGWGSSAPRPGSARRSRTRRRPRRTWRGLRPATLGELVAATELGHLAVAARASAASALFRTESRAAHYREDHPDTDPAWVATVAYADDRAWRRPSAVDRDERRPARPAGRHDLRAPTSSSSEPPRMPPRPARSDRPRTRPASSRGPAPSESARERARRVGVAVGRALVLAPLPRRLGVRVRPADRRRVPQRSPRRRRRVRRRW